MRREALHIQIKKFDSVFEEKEKQLLGLVTEEREKMKDWK